MSKLKKSRKKEIREQVRHLLADHLATLKLPAIDNFITGEDEADYVALYLTSLADGMRPRPESEEHITNEDIRNDYPAE